MWSWWGRPGAVGVNNVYESDVNLSFGLKFNGILKLNGYDTVLTRNDKNDIADKSLDTIAKRKNLICTKDLIFITVVLRM